MHSPDQRFDDFSHFDSTQWAQFTEEKNFEINEKPTLIEYGKHKTHPVYRFILALFTTQSFKESIYIDRAQNSLAKLRVTFIHSHCEKNPWMQDTLHKIDTINQIKTLKNIAQAQKEIDSIQENPRIKKNILLQDIFNTLTLSKNNPSDYEKSVKTLEIIKAWKNRTIVIHDSDAFNAPNKLGAQLVKYFDTSQKTLLLRKEYEHLFPEAPLEVSLAEEIEAQIAFKLAERYSKNFGSFFAQQLQDPSSPYFAGDHFSTLRSQNSNPVSSSENGSLTELIQRLSQIKQATAPEASTLLWDTLLRSLITENNNLYDSSTTLKIETFFNKSEDISISEQLEPEPLMEAYALFLALENQENASLYNEIIQIKNEIEEIQEELNQNITIQGILKEAIKSFETEIAQLEGIEQQDIETRLQGLLIILNGQIEKLSGLLNEQIRFQQKSPKEWENDIDQQLHNIQQSRGELDRVNQELKKNVGENDIFGFITVLFKKETIQKLQETARQITENIKQKETEVNLLQNFIASQKDIKSKISEIRNQIDSSQKLIHDNLPASDTPQQDHAIFKHPLYLNAQLNLALIQLKEINTPFHITKHKSNQLEKQLKEKEDHFRLIIETNKKEITDNHSNLLQIKQQFVEDQIKKRLLDIQKGPPDSSLFLPIQKPNPIDSPVFQEEILPPLVTPLDPLLKNIFAEPKKILSLLFPLVQPLLDKDQMTAVKNTFFNSAFQDKLWNFFIQRISKKKAIQSQLHNFQAWVTSTVQNTSGDTPKEQWNNVLSSTITTIQKIPELSQSTSKEKNPLSKILFSFIAQWDEFRACNARVNQGEVVILTKAHEKMNKLMTYKESLHTLLACSPTWIVSNKIAEKAMKTIRKHAQLSKQEDKRLEKLIKTIATQFIDGKHFVQMFSLLDALNNYITGTTTLDDFLASIKTIIDNNIAPLLTTYLAQCDFTAILGDLTENSPNGQNLLS